MYGISGGWLNHTESRDHQQKGAWFPLHSSPWAGPFANENLCPCIYVGYFLNVTLGGEAKLMVLYGHPITLTRDEFFQMQWAWICWFTLQQYLMTIKAVFLPMSFSFVDTQGLVWLWRMRSYAEGYQPLHWKHNSQAHLLVHWVIEGVVILEILFICLI